jgi:hypothetical protein
MAFPTSAYLAASPTRHVWNPVAGRLTDGYTGAAAAPDNGVIMRQIHLGHRRRSSARLTAGRPGMSRARILTVSLALLLGSSASDLQSAEGGSNPAAGASESPSEALWQRSTTTAGRWWEESQQRAGALWESSREKVQEAWEDTRRYLEAEDTDRFAEVWDGVLPTLEETLAREERQSDLPESSWFGEDQTSNQQAIDALLDQAVDLLSTSDLQQYRDRIGRLQREIEQARRDIADYRRLRVSAPRESLVNKTVADYEDAIEAREADITRFQEGLDAVEGDFAAELRGLGLELSNEQVELLLSTVVGDNLIDLGIVFDNVKAITEQLERLVAESREDLQSARRYYGLYVVLLKSLRQMHVQVEQAIAGQYIPQIDAIAERARELSAQTRGLMAKTPEKRELLNANLEAQRLTLEAADIYRDYLDDQGRQITAARVELETDIAAAWNTYETVRVSGELVDLVRASRRLLEGLLDRQVPALRPFRNLAMQREFERLTEQLRAGER